MTTRLWDFSASLLRDNDAGGAGGGDGATGGDAGGGGDGGSLAERAAAAVAEAGKSGGDGSAAAAAASQPYYPEGLGDTFRGKDNNETIDKLHAHITGLPKPPEKAEDYTLTLSEDFTKKFGELKDPADNKVLGALRQVFHKVGASNEQFGQVVEGVYTTLAAEGLLDLGPDPDAELDKLKPRDGDDKTRELAAFKRIDDSASFIKGLVAKGLPKEGAVMLSGLLENAQGVQVLEFLSRNLPGLQPGGGGPATPATIADQSLSVMYPTHFKT